MSDLVLDVEETRRIRRLASKSNKVKITINIDRESMTKLRRRSAKTGVPYQKLLNRFLRQALDDEEKVESRLDRIERELARLKRKIAA